MPTTRFAPVLRCLAVRFGLLCTAVIIAASGRAVVAADFAAELKTVPYKIVYESWQKDNWELMMVDTGPTEKKLGKVCEGVGAKAPGWNIGVADAGGKDRKLIITHDGASDKEPDWVPVPAK